MLLPSIEVFPLFVASILSFRGDGEPARAFDSVTFSMIR